MKVKKVDVARRYRSGRIESDLILKDQTYGFAS